MKPRAATPPPPRSTPKPAPAPGPARLVAVPATSAAERERFLHAIERLLDLADRLGIP